MLRRLSFTTIVGLILATALATAQAPTPAQPQPQTQTQTQTQTTPTQPIPPVTFKVEINYIEVDARVVDQQGNFVRNLKKEDFQILEDKKPQTINAFGLVDIPVERFERPLFATQPIEPDVVSNARGFDGRLYVLVLDDLHTNALRSVRVKAAARRFIEQNLGANDRAAVVVTSGRSDAAQDLTDNRRLLLAAVDKFIGQKIRSATLEKIEEYNRGVGSGTRRSSDRLDDPFNQERLWNARRALETLRSISDWMAGIHGRRKALVYISEGIDYDITDVFSSPDGSFNFNKANVSEIMEDIRDVIAAATRSNVSIYAVDPRGLTAMGDETIELGSLADAQPPPDDTGNSAQGGRGAGAGLGLSSLFNELQISQDNLRALGDETGGFAVVNRNDFTTAFDRIVEENSSYYVLGYYSTNEKRDGKFRKIDVRLNRPGLVVRARKGYLAPRGKAAKPAPTGATDERPVSGALLDLINSPVPVSGVTFSASAAAFKGNAPKNLVAVTVEASGKDMKFTPKDGKFNGKLEMSIVVADRDGKIKASERPTVNLALGPENYDRITQHGIRILSRLEVPPGRYQLRVAALDRGAGTGGSVQYDLEVPDFAKAPFSMSSLVLSSTAAGLMPTTADAQLGSVLPVLPVAHREFSADEELLVFAEVYDNQPTPPHKVDITSTVRADDGRVVFKNEEARSNEELQGARGGYGYMARIPLKGLAPGLYVLTVDARTRLGNAAAVSRVVQFRVR